ncbi:hypothetical protein P8452_34464 [Trifolium repens]|nr:hypothetical protein P8452_34464 [Trifolium repens]
MPAVYHARIEQPQPSIPLVGTIVCGSTRPSRHGGADLYSPGTGKKIAGNGSVGSPATSGFIPLNQLLQAILSFNFIINFFFIIFFFCCEMAVMMMIKY